MTSRRNLWNDEEAMLECLENSDIEGGSDFEDEWKPDEEHLTEPLESSSSDSEEDNDTTNADEALHTPSTSGTSARRMIWRATPFRSSTSPSLRHYIDDTIVHSPAEYFERYFTEELYETAALHTAQYHMSFFNKQMSVTPEDIKIFFWCSRLDGLHKVATDQDVLEQQIWIRSHKRSHV